MFPFTPPTPVGSLDPSNVEFFKNLMLWVPSHPVVGWQGPGRSQKSIAIPVIVATKKILTSLRACRQFKGQLNASLRNF
jgi:hypothetical protein